MIRRALSFLAVLGTAVSGLAFVVRTAPEAVAEPKRTVVWWNRPFR